MHDAGELPRPPPSDRTRDDEARPASERALRVQNDQLDALNRLVRTISSEHDLERIVQAVTDCATALSKARFGAFFYNVTDAQGERYVLYTLAGAPREAFERFGLPRNTEVFGPTFRGLGIVRSDDIRKDPRYGHNPPHHGMPKGHLPVVSYLAVPVISRSGEVHGGLFFGHDQAGVFTQEAEEIVSAVAAHAAIALDNAFLWKAAQREIELRRAAEESLARRGDEQSALYEFTNRLYRAERESDVYDAALDAIQHALRTYRASILLYDDSNVMRFVAWRGLSDAYRRAVEGHSPWTPDVTDPKPVTISDVAQADLPDALRDAIKAERIVALAFFPLLANGRLVGKFMVYYEQPHAFGDVEIDLAVTIARQLGFSMERRRAEEARALSEQELRKLTHSLESQVAERTRERDRIWQVTDDLLAVANFDGYFLSLNPAWTARLGWTERELKSMHVRELCHPEDLAETDRVQAALMSGTSTVRIENRFRHRDGNWRWIHWTMTTEDGLIYVIGKDVTDEKRASEILRESERQFRLLVGGVVDYALFMLDREGKVVSWNAGAERIKGYSAREIIGEHFSRFYTDEDRATRLPWRALAIAEREGRYEAEGWRVRRDGSRIWASVVIDAIRDEEGELAGFAKITRDITERREAQLKLEETQRQLAHAQKMEALGHLTGGVAHDFNNMLMVIGGQAAALRNRLTEQKDLRSIRAIELAAQRGETLTRQLLAFSRRQTLSPIPIRLQDRMEELRDVLRSSAREDIHLLISIPENIWPIAVDVAELQLALVNIIVNARDAMPQGGNITIVAENREVPAGTLADDLAGEFVAMHISDTGTGIPDDVLPRIFEPFFTTKQTARGTGLGLSQVYGFATQSGGTVTIASKVGRGTTVTLYLPRTHRQVVEEDRAPEIVRGSNETVLLVEDNIQVNDVTAELLENLGYRVLSTDSAAAALDVLKAEPSIALVFSDVVLPGELDGFGLARRIRQDYPQMPVLLATGYAHSRGPANEFPILRKPYQLAALAQAIRAAMGGQGKRRLSSAQDGDGHRPRAN